MENNPFRLELALEGGVVFNDAIVDDGNQPVAAQVGMRIAIGGRPVGCPAGVADAGAAGRWMVAKISGQVSNSAGPLAEMEMGAGQRRHPGTVIAAIFQPVESFKQQGFRFTIADIADDAAHVECLLGNYILILEQEEYTRQGHPGKMPLLPGSAASGDLPRLDPFRQCAIIGKLSFSSGERVHVQALTCPKGHQWEAPADRAEKVACPVCGCSNNGHGDPERTLIAVPSTPGSDDQPVTLAGNDRQPTPDEEPQELPNVEGYDLLEELGRGGMGVVYKARQLGLNRIVALKMVLAGEHAGPKSLGRFRSEAEAVARLQHPNIVQIYEVGEQDGRPYFSLEYVDGGSLAKHLAGFPQPAQPSARIVETLARAIHHGASVAASFTATLSRQTSCWMQSRVPSPNSQVEPVDSGLWTRDSGRENHRFRSRQADGECLRAEP